MVNKILKKLVIQKSGVLFKFAQSGAQIKSAWRFIYADTVYPFEFKSVCLRLAVFESLIDIQFDHKESLNSMQRIDRLLTNGINLNSNFLY